jgi:hypothetical protein
LTGRRSITALLVLTVAGLSLAGCQSKEEGLRAATGDGKLPLAKILPGETVGIRLSSSSLNDTAIFSATLRADGRLTIRRFRILPTEGPYGERKTIVEAERKATLTPALATEIRQRLSVFRPVTLSSEGPFLFPRDCGFGFHVQSRAVVAFGDGTDKSGLFVLQEHCDNRHVNKLVSELKEVVELLPGVASIAPPDW